MSDGIEIKRVYPVPFVYLLSSLFVRCQSLSEAYETFVKYNAGGATAYTSSSARVETRLVNDYYELSAVVRTINKIVDLVV